MVEARSTPVALVIEDEWLVRQDIVDALRAAGWETIEHSSAEDAIGLLGSDSLRIDVVFTDIQLAGDLSGWDVAEAFRTARPAIAIIYASGNAVDRSRSVAGSVFLAKPYNIGDAVKACVAQVTGAGPGQ